MPLPALAAPAASSISPLVAAAGIGAGSSLAGGFLSSNFLSGSSKKDRRFQREVMQNALQWRVNDAKAAGIHPLFALGAQVATGASGGTFIGDPLGPSLAEAGQNISNAIVRSKGNTERLSEDLSLRLMRSQIGETDARRNYYDSLAAQNNQARLAGGSGLGPQMEDMPGQSPEIPGTGVIDLSGSKQVTAKKGDPSSRAGTHTWNELSILDPKGKLPMFVPGRGDEHPMETMSESGTLGEIRIMIQDAKRYGQLWPNKLRDNLRYWYAGAEPSVNWTEVLRRLPHMDKVERQSFTEGTRNALDRALGGMLKKERRYQYSDKRRFKGK